MEKIIQKREYRMDFIENKITELNKIDNNWIQMVKEFQKNQNKENDIDKEIIKNFNELYDWLKKAYKEDNNTIKKKLIDTFGEENGSWLENMIKNSLKVYFAMESFRNIQEDNEEIIKIAIQFIFNNVILRHDPQFVKKYKSYGFKSRDDFYEAAYTLNMLTAFYIDRHYTRDAIVADFFKETDLEKSICCFFADEIEKNYITLQLNFIIDMRQNMQI